MQSESGANDSLQVVLHQAKPNETTPLIGKETIFLETPLGRLILTATLGVGGALIIFLHIAPGQMCAKDPECGQWLTDFLGKYLMTPTLATSVAPMIYTILAGGEVAVLNIYMAINTRQAVVDFIMDIEKGVPRSRKGVVTAAGAITLFAATQALEKLCVALATGASVRNTIFATLGAMPPAMFTFIKLRNHVLPYYLSRFRHDHVEQARFSQAVEEKWFNVLANLETVTCQNDEKAVSFLARHSQGEKRISPWQGTALQAISEGMGILSAAYIYLPLMKNVEHEMEEFVGEGAAIVLTPMLSIALMYSVTHIMIETMQSGTQLLRSLIKGEPIPSLSFQVNPALTSAIWALSVLTASLSYATVLLIFRKNYSDAWPYKEQASFADVILIDIAHLGGSVHLFNELFTHCLRTRQHEFLFEVQAWVRGSALFPLEKFKNLVQGLTDQERTALGITLIKKPTLQNNMHDAHGDEVKASPNTKASPASFQRSKRLGVWCCQWLSDRLWSSKPKQVESINTKAYGTFESIPRNGVS